MADPPAAPAAFVRMNFLYQAAVACLTGERVNVARARFFVASLQQVARRNVLRLFAARRGI